MQLQTFWAQNQYGQLIPSATVSVYDIGTTNLATGLEDSTGAALTNPFSADSQGKISFYAPDGIYDMTVVAGTTSKSMAVQFLDLAAQVESAAASAASATATEAEIKEIIANAGEQSTLVVLASADGMGKIGAPEGGTLVQKVDWVSVEQFKLSTDTDDTSAIQKALNYCANNDIMELRGAGSYTINAQVFITGFGSRGFKAHFHKISAGSSFPANTTLFDAQTMITISDASSQQSNLEIIIDYLDGGGVANGIRGAENGYALSHIHIGFAKNCIQVINQTDYTFDCGCNRISGDYWNENWIGGFLNNGTNGSIFEGWMWDVKFIADNRYGGLWYKKGGQYAQIYAGNLDYNGKYISEITLSGDTSTLDLIKGQVGIELTNGTTASMFMFHFQETYNGSQKILLGESKDVSVATNGSSKTSYAVGDVLTCPTISGVSLTVSAVNVAGDSSSGANYYDFLHDYADADFGRLQILAAYMSRVVGSQQYTSVISYQNAFSGTTDNFRGLGVSNSGQTLALYNNALSASNSFANITADFVNFALRLYQKDRKYEGNAGYAAPAAGATATIGTITPSAYDHYAGEADSYQISITSPTDGVYAFAKLVLNSQNGYLVDIVTSANLSLSGVKTLASDGTTLTGYAINCENSGTETVALVMNIVRI